MTISQYTSAPFTYPGGGIAAGVPVAVYFADTTVHAELYHEALGAVRKANPTRTDGAGVITFFIEPGTYDLVANGVTTTVVVPGVVDPPGDDNFITKAQADALYVPLGGALTNPMTADLAMGTHKITGLVAGVAGTDAVNKTQMESADTALIAAHNAASDPHGDRAFAVGAVDAHEGDSDPHGDRAYALAQANLKLPLTGGTLTGDLAITDGATKAYRLRRSGGALDFEGAGAKVYFSVWSAGDFTGTQRNYLVLESGASIAQAVGQWQWRETADGTERHRIDALTGVASLGSKNGLTNVKMCGLKSTPGSPTTGTWDVGDMIIDSVGATFICLTAGTPGVWAGSNDLTTVSNTNTSAYQYFMLPNLGVTTTISPADGSAYFTPLVLQKSANLTDVQLEVTTLDAAGSIRCGLASSNADGYPGTWINDLGNFAAITSTGVKSLSAAPNVELSAGVRYWIAIAPQGGTTTVQLRGRSGWNAPLPPVLVGTTPGGGSGAYNASRTHFRATGITGAMSGAITLADLISSGPTVGVKVV